MTIDKSLIFDIWGDYAHFRKIYSTTSPLTYVIPTKTALLGLIAAILGLDTDSYYETFNQENARIALRILNPIKIITHNLNIIKTDDDFSPQYIKKNPRSPIHYQFVKDPHYRIYCWLKDVELYDKLKNYLKEHLCVYTPYLGISELIAEFCFIKEAHPVEKTTKTSQSIDSVVNLEKYTIIPEDDKHYGEETLPMEMNSSRVVLAYSSFIFELFGKPITIQQGTYYEIEGENVLFF